MTETFRYHAFISYRHADNKELGRQWATWLHQAIETYEVPADLIGQKNARGEKIPERVYPIFRDEEELPAHADLGTSIVRALDETRLLVVLCSPRAVTSTYVADEIEYFKKLGRSGSIIAAMIDGEPNASWDEGKQESGFKAKDECFPIPLQFEYDENGERTKVRAEPIAADFRINNEGSPEQGWTSPEAYRQHLKATSQLDPIQIQEKVALYQQQLHLMKMKIIAGILGLPLGELTRRDKEYQLEQARLKAQRLRQWLAVVAVLALLAVGAGILAYWKQVEAEEQRHVAVANEKVADEQRNRAIKNEEIAQAQRRIAEQERNKATERFQKVLAIESQQATAENNPELGLLLALEGVSGQTATPPPVRELSVALQHALRRTYARRVYRGHSAPVQSTLISPDGRLLASATEDNVLSVRNVTTGEEIARYPDLIGAEIRFRADSKSLVYISHGGNAGFGVIELSAQGAQRHTPLSEYAATAVLSRDGKWLVEQPLVGKFFVWDVASAKRRGPFVLDSDYVRYFDITPDGARLVTYTEPGHVQVWDMSSLKREGEFQCEIEEVTTLDMGLDGAVVFAGKKGLAVYSLEKQERLFALDEKLERVFVTPSGKLACSGETDGNKVVRIFSPSDWREESRVVIATFASVGDFVIDRQGTILARADQNSIEIYDIATGFLKAELSGHSGKVNAMAFSRGGQLLFSAADDHTVRSWELTRNKVSMLGGEPVEELRVSDDGGLLLAIRAQHQLAVYDLENNIHLSNIEVQTEDYLNAEFSPGGKRVLSWGFRLAKIGEEASAQTLDLWESRTGKHLKSFDMDNDYGTSLAVSSNGRRMAIKDPGGTIIVADVQTGAIVSRIEGTLNHLSFLLISADGRSVMTGDTEKQSVQLWSADSGAEIKRVWQGEPDQRDYPSEATLDGARNRGLMLAGAENELIVWDFGAQQEKVRLRLGGDAGSSVRVLQPSPSGAYLAVVVNSSIRIIHPDSGTIHLLPVQYSHYGAQGKLIFDPLERFILVVRDQQVELWSLENGTFVGSIGSKHGSTVRIDSTGSYIALESEPDHVALWDVGTLSQIGSMRTSGLSDFRFRDGASELVVASHNSGLRVWPYGLDPARLLAQARQAASRELTREERRRYLGE